MSKIRDREVKNNMTGDEMDDGARSNKVVSEQCKLKERLVCGGKERRVKDIIMSKGYASNATKKYNLNKSLNSSKMAYRFTT